MLCDPHTKCVIIVAVAMVTATIVTCACLCEITQYLKLIIVKPNCNSSCSKMREQGIYTLNIEYIKDRINLA